MYTPPVKKIEALPLVPRKSSLRTVCLRAGKTIQAITEDCLVSPPKKRDVHALKSSPKKRVRFDVQFLDDVEVHEFDAARAFKHNTARWRKADAAMRKALRSGAWKKSKGLFVHVASDTMLLESGFLAVLLNDLTWPPVRGEARSATPSPPRASARNPGSPPATACTDNPCKHL
jgi:hypothetical protein